MADDCWHSSALGDAAGKAAEVAARALRMGKLYTESNSREGRSVERRCGRRTLGTIIVCC